MTLYVLSRRHSLLKTYCDCCNRFHQRTARVALDRGEAALVTIRICAPCAREIARAASEPPKPRVRR